MTLAPVAVTVGDVAGIGPEVVLAWLRRGRPAAPVLLVGSARALDRARAWVTGAPKIPVVAGPEALLALGGPGAHAVALDAESDAASERAFRADRPAGDLPAVGRVDARAGAASHLAVARAADLARAGRVRAMVTGPIHKVAWALAGVPDPGHTEALARCAGVERTLLLLASPVLRVACATLHVALRDVPGLLTAAGLERDLVLLDEHLRRDVGIAAPRLAVCGLNPHAGEGGRFGDEDARVIAPAVERARSRGVDVAGPLPADACIPQAAAGCYDAVLATHHDQGLPAVKALSPRACVNVTLGLPFVRTSVDHGTAFDVAGLGTASPDSLAVAFEAALALSARRAAVGAGGA